MRRTGAGIIGGYGVSDMGAGNLGSLQELYGHLATGPCLEPQGKRE